MSRNTRRIIKGSILICSRNYVISDQDFWCRYALAKGLFRPPIRTLVVTLEYR